MNKQLTLFALALTVLCPATVRADDPPATLESTQAETRDLFRSFKLNTPEGAPCPYEIDAKWVRATCGVGGLFCRTWYFYPYLEITTKIPSSVAGKCPGSISVRIPRIVATNTNDTDRCHILWNRGADAPATIGEIIYPARRVRVSLPGARRIALEGDRHLGRNARQANPYGGPPVDGSYFCINYPPVWFFLAGTGPAGSDKPHKPAEIANFNNFSTIPEGGY